MRSVPLAALGRILLLPMGASGQAVDVDRVFVSINAVHQCCVQDGGYSFWLSEPLSRPAGDETGRFAVRHHLGGAVARDVSARLRVWRNLAVGAGVSTLHTQSQAEVVRVDEAGVRYFDRHGGGGAPANSVSGLDHRQAGYHFEVAWIVRLTDRFEVTAFGGPSHFSVNYESVVDESGGHIGSWVVTRPATRRTIGGNFGFDFTLLMNDRLGVGILVRFAGATVDSPTGHGRESLRVGGSQLGVGARLRF